MVTENSISGSVINGTSENDTLTNYADNVTIYGYAGGDSITNSYETYTDGYGNWATLTANNVIIQAGDGNDYIYNGGYDSANNATIDAGSGNDTLNLHGQNLVVDAGDGDDSVTSGSVINNSIIYLGEGNDKIHSYGGDNFTINGGNGDDSIHVGCVYPEKIVGVPPENVMVISGDGNDTIINEGTNSTITAGSGNDTVYLSGSDGGSLASFYYNLGDGNDTIFNYTSTDTLNIVGASYSSATVGNDIVITVAGGTANEGTITLKDVASGTPINIISDGGGGTTDTTEGGGTTEPSTNETVATDYVFILDYSGSMSQHIEKVANIAEQFKNDLTSRNIDYRLGIVEYRDEGEIQSYDFTTDIDEFVTDLNTVASKAGYNGEYGLTAIETALEMDFREGASKKFIVISDEGYTENDLGVTSNLTTDSVIESLNVTNVTLNAIGAMPGKYYADNYNVSDGNGSCKDEWTYVAESTKGYFYDIDGDYGDILGAIIDGVPLPTGSYMQLSDWSYAFNFPTSENSSNMILASAT